MNLVLANVQYHPNSDAVAFHMQDARGVILRPGSQTALAARVPGGVWGDAEALAEAQAVIDAEFPGDGYVVVLPTPPTPPDPAPADVPQLPTPV